MTNTKVDVICIDRDRLALEIDRVDAFFCEYLAHQIVVQKLGSVVRVRDHSSDSVEEMMSQTGLVQQRQQIMRALSKHLLGSLTTLLFLKLIDPDIASVMDSVLFPAVPGAELDIESLIKAGFLVRNTKTVFCLEPVSEDSSFLQQLIRGIAI